MGGSVSSGKSNDELVDHLVDSEYIRTPAVERVFRAVDRGNYYSENRRQNAYKDIAWRMGNLHLSAPCVYSVVMEALKLRPGLSFLNLGSGSGYLSTMAGLVLGPYGINHGIEFYSDIVDYANFKLEEFLKTSKAVDEYDFCEPVFTVGNCLTVDSNFQQYDRVYCGAACPVEYESCIKNFVKIGGILIVPLNDKLLKITRVDESNWTTVKVLSVSFAPLIVPPLTNGTVSQVKLGDVTPPKLQQLCRSSIRCLLRRHVDLEHPGLKLKDFLKVENKEDKHVRRIIIPFFDDSDLSNSRSNSEIENDSDNPEYTTSSHLPSRMSSFLENFLRRHAELQLLREVKQVHSGSDSEAKSSKTNASSKKSSTCKIHPSKNSSSKSKTTQKKEGIKNEMNTIVTRSSDNQPRSLTRMSKIKPPNSSDESNSHQPPSQSTRSKKKLLLKRKRSSQSISSNDVASTSSGTTSEPRKKVKRSSTTVFPTEIVHMKTEKKKFEREDVPNFNYTHFMIQKLGALPLPSPLIRYLNYKRDNL